MFFFLPNSVQIVSEGEVMRIEKEGGGSHRYGVRFVSISPSVQSQIESFIVKWLIRKKRSRS